MKLFKFIQNGKSKCGVEINGIKYSAARHIKDYSEKFFESNGLSHLQDLAERGVLTPLKTANLKFDAPIARPSKIVCIGLNYAKHAAESGMALPVEPIVFFKSTTALCGPNDDVIIPRNSEKTDWEVELAVVIGKKTSYVTEEEAMDYVLGYALHNDYSERAFQLERGGQWVKGKSNDTFAPLGPVLVTKDEVPDPENLRLWLSVDGQMLQDSNTNDLVFGIKHLVSYLSHFMTLLPGDVISTGTPAGVGLGLKPPRYLQGGEVIELGIEGLGTQRQVAVRYEQ